MHLAQGPRVESKYSYSGIFTDYESLEDKSVTQGTISRSAPRCTLVGVQKFKNFKFPRQDNLSLAVNGLNKNIKILMFFGYLNNNPNLLNERKFMFSIFMLTNQTIHQSINILMTFFSDGSETFEERPSKDHQRDESRRSRINFGYINQPLQYPFRISFWK